MMYLNFNTKKKCAFSFMLCCGIVYGVVIFTKKLPSWNITYLTAGKTGSTETTARRDPIIVIDWTGYNILGPKTYLADGCLVTRDRTLLNRSHAVVISHGRQREKNFPKVRHMRQRWIWEMEESPFNSFYLHKYGFNAIKNMFNWTMTYRTSSDVYTPYGWTTRRSKPEPIPDSIGNRSGIAVTVISNCDLVHNGRFSYVRKLQNSANVQIYGRCVNKMCPGYDRGVPFAYCQAVKNFLFYLAFENSNCQEYITEKTFSHGFSMGAVPVVMGAPKADYIAIAPPNSFIHVDDFAGPAELGKYLTFLSKNKTEYMKYHEWRRDYMTSFRTAYVNDEPLWEALCRALKSDSGKPKVYPDIAKYWTAAECRRP